MMRVHPIILAGGAGRRLWPWSSPSRPKPFLRPPGAVRTLLEDTLVRLTAPLFTAPGLVIAETTCLLAAQSCRHAGINPQFIISEPMRRDTAPALTLAALALVNQGARPDALMLASPADHRVNRPEALVAAIGRACVCADKGGIVAFGIRPIRAETQYGYIAVGTAGLDGVSRIRAFHEKPDATTASEYLQDTTMLWNGGMLLVRIETWLSEMRCWAPECLSACQAAVDNGDSPRAGLFRPQATAFQKAPNISIDHAVMEKTDCGHVVPLNVDWEDMGDWSRMLGPPTPPPSLDHHNRRAGG